LYLNVAVSKDVKEFSDRAEQQGGLTRRLFQIPAPKHGQRSLVIDLRYGPQVSPEVIRTINTSITSIAKPTKRKPTLK